ncbi:unnamed protein product [Hymenolepis diminuta]|uniref:Pecanex-like protein n=1 Tax=Hymenolepis diminuta TaxID=6216 RepID=A0A0R3SBA3_HYMDI|nr:unnamed protein product [Hymenolepis diminuta]
MIAVLPKLLRCEDQGRFRMLYFRRIQPTFYMRDHEPNGTWAEGIIRAWRGRVQYYEMDVDGQTWMRHREHLSHQYAAQLSKLEANLLGIILDVYGPSEFENNETPEIKSSNQQNHRSEIYREPPKRFKVNLTFKSYDRKLSLESVG